MSQNHLTAIEIHAYLLVGGNWIPHTTAALPTLQANGVLLTTFDSPERVRGEYNENEPELVC